LPLCCREENGYPKDPKDGAGKYGSYNCDLPYTIVEALYKTIKEDLPETEFILWTGDNIPHDIWNQSFEKNTKSSIILTKDFKEKFPEMTFYPIHGNHEYFPVNLDDFKQNNKQIKILAEQWE
jgi:hypothetical protein